MLGFVLHDKVNPVLTFYLSLQDETTLPNGQKFDLLSLALLGTTQFADRFHTILTKLVDLKFDVPEYICIKFIILLNPGNVVRE